MRADQAGWSAELRPRAAAIGDASWAPADLFRRCHVSGVPGALRGTAWRPRHPRPTRGSGAARLLCDRGQRVRVDDHGNDAAVVHRLGDDLMRRVQHRNMDQFFGEQPIGTAFTVPRAIPLSGSVPTPRPCGCPAASKVPTRSNARHGRRYWPSRPITRGPTNPSRRPSCRRWVRASVASRSVRRPGKWPRPIATSLIPRVGSTGSSSTNGTGRSATMVIVRSRGKRPLFRAIHFGWSFPIPSRTKLSPPCRRLRLLLKCVSACKHGSGRIVFVLACSAK